MSRVTKRKHVLKEQECDEYDLPKENQQIVRIFSSRGNNLHEVETANEGEDRFLVSMPVKFRKNVWIKRGDFVLVEPIDEGDKVKAEICRILTSEHIKIFEQEGVWPKKFTKKRDLEDDVDGEGLFKNTNRPRIEDESSEEESSNEDIITSSEGGDDEEEEEDE